MSGYRPPRFSGLGAHVSGVSAWVLVSILERAKAAESIQKIPGDAARQEVFETYDALRAAGIYWNERRQGVLPDPDPEHPPTGAAQGGQPVTQYLSAVEAGRLIGCTERRVRQLLAEERLSGRRLSGRWLIDPVSVEDYLLIRKVA
ncbi:hypothetical protein SAMN05660916_03022 [Arthrobacter sp. 31Cvi3.1E]|nr:hypothetical protein SAMN05660916_03022 [Arthrobacter sp. 31Cvi3.1E]